jgi:hypothetical protein
MHTLRMLDGRLAVTLRGKLSTSWVKGKNRPAAKYHSGPANSEGPGLTNLILASNSVFFFNERNAVKYG